MYLNGIYSVSHFKFDLMWLKIDLMWLFSNHISVVNTDGSHITVHSLKNPSVCLFVLPSVTLYSIVRVSATPPYIIVRIWTKHVHKGHRTLIELLFVELLTLDLLRKLSCAHGIVGFLSPKLLLLSSR